ncbi:unnamed protein product [Amoebophrya sp. A25]|nr:unnamed protein product [Amoebophrya sp. A25]|eukprot:GSA25T00009620001.1
MWPRSSVSRYLSRPRLAKQSAPDFWNLNRNLNKRQLQWSAPKLQSKQESPKQDLLSCKKQERNYASSQRPTVVSKSRKTVAIVGSGPAGFYTAKYLLSTSAAVDVHMYDQWITPFGLVRYGVAPDHPEVKNVINDFEQVVAKSSNAGAGGSAHAGGGSAAPRFQYFGNVRIGDLSAGGRGVPLGGLQERYDAVVLATGASFGKRSIRGPTHDAFSFVQWYNGFPTTDLGADESVHTHYKDLPVRDRNEFFSSLKMDSTTLSEGGGARVSLFGLGNVALDAARMLLSTSALSVRHSDIVETARLAIGKWNVRHVDLFGRRGAVQSQFGTKELRELLHATDFRTVIDPLDLERSLNSASREELGSIKMKQRQMKIFEQMAQNFEAMEKAKESTGEGLPVLQLRFLHQPVKYCGDSHTLSVRKTRLSGKPHEQRAEFDPDAPAISIRSSLVLESVGFGFRPLDRRLLPYHEKAQQESCEELHGEQEDVGPLNVSGNGMGHVFENVFCVGWLKRGPRGTIASNVPDAAETAAGVKQFLGLQPAAAEHDARTSSLSKNPKLEHATSFDDWLRLKAVEEEGGKKANKLAQKVVDVAEQMKCIRQA